MQILARRHEFIEAIDILLLPSENPIIALWFVSADWVFNYVVVMVTVPSFQNIRFYAYIGKVFRSPDVYVPSEMKDPDMSHHFI